MKLGIYLNSQHPESDDPARRLAETLEQARLIRSLGFDSIWAGEHHVTPGFHFFPQLALLQCVAAEAPGLWLGTNVTLLPLHNPVELAELGAFLDVATGGRFLLGVGLGYRPEEYAIYGDTSRTFGAKGTASWKRSRLSGGCGARTTSAMMAATGSSTKPAFGRDRCSRHARQSLSVPRSRRPSCARQKSAMAG